MFATSRQPGHPFRLAVTGEAERLGPALRKIVGQNVVDTYPVHDRQQLIDVVQANQVDAAVLDDQAGWDLDVLQLLRMVRRINQRLPVVVVTSRSDRRTLEDLLRLTAFSVEVRPLELESLLRQIQRIMVRLDRVLREGGPSGTDPKQN